jgi:hypothetical protein
MKYLTSAIAAEGDIEAQATAKYRLVANVEVNGDTNVSLSRTVGLNSTLTSSGALASNLLVKVPLTAALDATSLLDSLLFKTVGIAVSVQSVSFLSANINRVRHFPVDITADIDVEADLTRVSPIGCWFYAPGAINKVLD